MLSYNIEKTCRNFMDKYNINTPVSNCYELVEKMGGHITKEFIEDDALGFIEKYNDSFLIILNKDLDEPYDRIAIAQLIGIICLYTPYERNHEAWKDYSQEIVIDNKMFEDGLYFAKELFMPRCEFTAEFCKHITLTHKINLNCLVKIFNVPMGLVRERCADLKLIVTEKENNPRKK